MLSLIIPLALSRKPVILSPPMFGSHLHVSADNFHSHWYCTKTFTDRLIWLSEGYLIPPILNCLGEYLTSEWDDVAKSARNRTNVTVWTPDFGGDSSVRYVDAGILGLHFIPDLVKVLDEFESHGYEVRKDMYGAPYDWRNGPLYIPEYYDQLKTLCEEAYESSGEKVALFGYSEGSMVLHWFLAKTGLSQEWKDKYIDRVIFAMPSQAGSMDAVRVAWDQWLDKLPEFMRTESLEHLFESVPTLAAHMPNLKLTPKVPLIKGPNGEEFYADDLNKWLGEHEKVTGDNAKMMQAAKDLVYSQEVLFPGVNSYIVYNSGLETALTLDFAKGWDKPYTAINAPGDNTVLADVVTSMCKQWTEAAGGKTVVCHDFNRTSSDFSHINMLSAPEFVAVVYDMVNSEEWVVPGGHSIVGADLIGWQDIKKRK